MSSQVVILSTGEGGEYAWFQVPSEVGGYVQGRVGVGMSKGMGIPEGAQYTRVWGWV